MVSSIRKRPHRSGAIFVCGDLATFLAPGRGTYGLIPSAAFQGCKDRRKILEWRHMRAFSGSVSEWCGRADAARLLPQQPPSGRAAAGRTQAAAAPAAAWRPGRIRLAAGQDLLVGGSSRLQQTVAGLCPYGCFDRVPNAYSLNVGKRENVHLARHLPRPLTSPARRQRAR